MTFYLTQRSFPIPHSSFSVQPATWPVSLFQSFFHFFILNYACYDLSWDVLLKFLFQISFSTPEWHNGKFLQGISRLLPTFKQHDVNDVVQNTPAPSNKVTNVPFDRSLSRKRERSAQPVFENSDEDKEGKHNGFLLADIITLAPPLSCILIYWQQTWSE